ncbi:MAG: DUF86 domain-containing protein, partial [Phaeodactylibacter sp.]|nr:DUF86 domain-containing protein [Phaeodactylibacter sp.]
FWTQSAQSPTQRYAKFSVDNQASVWLCVFSAYSVSKKCPAVWEQAFQLSHVKQIIDFRNRLIHSYDNVDDTIVWAILNNHLPILKAEVELGLKK